MVTRGHDCDGSHGGEFESVVASGGDIDDMSLMTMVVMVVNDGDRGCTNYHCITDHSQNLTTQTTHIYYLIVSVGQESEHGFSSVPLAPSLSQEHNQGVSMGCGLIYGLHRRRICFQAQFLLGSWISLGVGLAGRGEGGDALIAEEGFLISS